MTSTTARLGLWGFTLFLLLFPLTLGKPGLPTHLKADESAYYGMAVSLAHDHDLRFDQRDVDRFFDEFPYAPVNNLILMSADGWRSARYGKPFVYSLLAAPFARFFGADGLLFCNALLLVAMIWMGALYLRRYNEEGLAVLYAIGFFVLSVGFAYVFWLQPEVFNMAAVTACLFLGLPREMAEEGLPRPRRELLMATLSGIALALAVYNKPMLLIVGVAPLVAWWRARAVRQIVAWCAGVAACLGLLAALSYALTGTPTSYLGVQRGGFTLCGPGQMPVFPGQVTPARAGATSTARGAAATPALEGAVAPSTPPGAAATPKPQGPTGAAQAIGESATGNTYRWLFRLPDTSPSELADNILYFLFGRHTGLFLYMPFAVLSLLLFLVHGGRALERWALLGAVVAVAFFFLLLIAWNWQGGGGFVGNRYFVNVYPAFLFLVTRIKPRVLVPIGYAWAGLFLSTLLFTPLGAIGPEPTLQMHVRAVPFRWFPLELTLRNVPGYQRVSLGDFRLVGRREVFLPLGEAMWLQGATPVELYLIGDRPLPPLSFQLVSDAPDNRVDVRMGDFHQTFQLGMGEARTFELPPQPPLRHWRIKPGPLYAWRLVITSAHGRPRIWEREFPPNACPGWPWQAKQQDSFYSGVELTYLGASERLRADVYHAEWRHVLVPAAVRTGEAFTAQVRVINRSAATWPNRGGARVRLAYHWVDGSGRYVQREGERTELPQPVERGAEVQVTQHIVAPAQPGRYTLVLEPLFETVAWFGDRDPRSEWRGVVDVQPPPVATTPAPVVTPAAAPGTSPPGTR